MTTVTCEPPIECSQQQKRTDRMKQGKTIGIALFAFLLSATMAYSDYDPHPADINYSENYRGQYHFSPKTEWMNDINGLMYLDGKYHMIYQWGERIRHGG